MFSRYFFHRIMRFSLFLWVIASLNARAAEVVYIDVPDGQPYTRQQLATAARFYGLEIRVFVLGDNADTAIKVIRDAKPVAAVIAADALPALSPTQVFAALDKKGDRVPLLVAGISESTAPALLKQWSAGTITTCRKWNIERGTGGYIVAEQNSITRQLGGSKMPLANNAVRSLSLGSGHSGEWLMAATSPRAQLLPTFVHTSIGRQDVFFATSSVGSAVPVTSDPYCEPAVFAALAPSLIFLRYAAGERAWHSPGHYANLTVDDAWLRESYGYVNYEGLLRQMERHNFHTTIAFVPWNFDRSEPAVVSLFRAHSDRFSICIHGNNHDHWEFGPYESKPLSHQVNDIKQGLARMAKFSQLTRLSYDPVMVFPHSISQEKTLAVLKHYNFEASANSLNVPLGSATPADPTFPLKTVTLAFSNFPSLRRYSAEAPIPDSQLAIDAFLSNPMLFYVHEGFFAPGLNAFNKTADAVNKIQPDTQWRSLGYIARHLYLERLRNDGNYDVQAYSARIELENTQKRHITFFVEKDEDFTHPLTLLVDGRPYPYQRRGTEITLQVSVPPRTTREVTVRYQNDLNFADIDISKSSLRIALIRHLSDFRDDVVSKTALGRWFIASYAQNTRWWSRVIAITVILLLAAIVFCFLRFRDARKLLA
jgi:peptidoglycan/xylan/chitin deacetylase (PgdA/CDA1 family)